MEHNIGNHVFSGTAYSCNNQKLIPMYIKCVVQSPIKLRGTIEVEFYEGFIINIDSKTSLFLLAMPELNSQT